MELKRPDWYAVHVGKCSSCGEDRSLDSMIADDLRKASYHCKDCEPSGYVFSELSKASVPVEGSRFARLMGWCFG